MYRKSCLTKQYPTIADTLKKLKECQYYWTETPAFCIPPSFTVIKGINDVVQLSFDELDLQDITFEDCSFNVPNEYEGVVLESLRGASFNGCHFKGAVFKNCIFNHSSLIHIWFKDCLFENVTFNDCNLSKTLFDGCEIHDMTFNQCQLCNTHFGNSLFCGTNTISDDSDTFGVRGLDGGNAPVLKKRYPDGDMNVWVALMDCVIYGTIPADKGRYVSTDEKGYCEAIVPLKIYKIDTDESVENAGDMKRGQLYTFTENFRGNEEWYGKSFWYSKDEAASHWTAYCNAVEEQIRLGIEYDEMRSYGEWGNETQDEIAGDEDCSEDCEEAE
jgi:hypothetical protein